MEAAGGFVDHRIMCNVDEIRVKTEDLFDVFDLLFGDHAEANEGSSDEEVVFPSHSHTDHTRVYRKHAIMKWLKKRERRSFSCYKVKLSTKTSFSRRCTSSGKFVESKLKFVSVTEL